MSDAKRSVMRYPVDHDIPEVFQGAYCNDCNRITTIEDDAYDHVKKTGHQMVLRYTKSYYAKAQ